MKNNNQLDLAENNSNGVELEKCKQCELEGNNGVCDRKDCNNFNMTKTIEEMFERIDRCVSEYNEGGMDGVREIIQEVTKQIQSDLLKEVYQRNRNHQPSEDKEEMFRDDQEKLAYICGRVDVVNDIKKLAEEKDLN